MVPVSLKHTNGIVCESNRVILTSYKWLITTKEPSEGLWYYEVEFFNSNPLASIGYNYDADIDKAFDVGPRIQAQNSFFSLYFYGQIGIYVNSMNQSVNLSTTLSQLGAYEDETIVGIAYDTYSHIFSIFYKNSFQHINITCPNCGNKVSPIFIESTSRDTSNIYKDEIEVNFGSKPFRYGIPNGYKAWNQVWRIITCNQKNLNLKPLLRFSSSFFLLLS